MGGGLEFLNEHSQFFINLGGVVTAAGAMWGIYVKWIRPKWRRVIGTWDAIDRIEAKQKTISEELRFNGGHSTKDMVAAIKRSQDDMAGEIALVRGIQRAIMSSHTTAYFETDRLGRHVWVNRGYLDLTGKQLADVLVNGWGATIAPLDRAAVLREWADCIQQDRDFDMQYRVVDADQNLVHIRATARRVKTQDGLTIAWAGSWVKLDQPPTAH